MARRAIAATGIAGAAVNQRIGATPRSSIAQLENPAIEEIAPIRARRAVVTASPAFLGFAWFVQFDLRAQNISGIVAIRKARAHERQRGAQTVIRNRLARETRTTHAAVQTRMGAAPTFARRNLALIKGDGAQTKPIERANFAMRK